MSFLFYDPRPQMRKADGTLCANGSLTFTLTNTSTASDVYADADLSTNLGNVITLGADARSPTPLWGDSEIQYRIELKDSLGATIAGYPIDDVSGADFGGVNIPDPTSGDAGDVISTDGSVYELRPIREVPDGTGHDGEVLTTTDNVSSWTALPTPDELPDGGITQDPTSFTIGKFLVQTGTGTAATIVTGRSRSGTVTFPTEFDATPLFIGVEVTNGSLSANGNMPSVAVTASGATSFTFLCTMGELSSPDSDFDFNASVTIKYVAMGLIP